ncbi:hypothetical protein CYMTET_56859 [Cymbomonas tetramitiformis]|uniref:TFIIS N-terminal domain-containing protein n=1 Tax=Cymbomonas tetramitiformis TaxID=36881 RepID=A0AAE0ELE9_9CHLO|nr:hypothetical protein CYMTET_56859 [Cymbomonas tetramitiformis]
MEHHKRKRQGTLFDCKKVVVLDNGSSALCFTTEDIEGCKEKLLDERATPKELLQTLGKLSSYIVSASVLAETKVGSVVKRLRKHQDLDVSRVALNLFHKWRNQIFQEIPTEGTRTLTTGGSRVSGATACSSGASNVRPIPQQRDWRSSSGAVDSDARRLTPGNVSAPQGRAKAKQPAVQGHIDLARLRGCSREESDASNVATGCSRGPRPAAGGRQLQEDPGGLNAGYVPLVVSARGAPSTRPTVRAPSERFEARKQKKLELEEALLGESSSGSCTPPSQQSGEKSAIAVLVETIELEVHSRFKERELQQYLTKMGVLSSSLRANPELRTAVLCGWMDPRRLVCCPEPQLVPGNFR